MAFQPINRTLLNNSSDSLNQQISARIAGIDEKAVQIRGKAAKKGEMGDPEFDLRPDVQELVGNINVATSATIARADLQLEGFRDSWNAARDKAPERELASIQRAQNRINGMDNTAVLSAAQAYWEGAETLDMFEINEIAARLRTSGAEAEAITFGKAVEALNGREPWLQNPEARSIIQYRDALARLEPGSALYLNPGEGVEMHLPIGELIDFYGEMNSV